jgi:hypothetical protein
MGKEGDAYPIALCSNPAQIIVTQRSAKYNTRDTFKMIYPLFPSAFLTINLDYSDR